MERWLFTPRNKDVGSVTVAAKMRAEICDRMLIRHICDTQGLELPDFEEMDEIVERDECIYYMVGDPAVDLRKRVSVPAQYHSPPADGTTTVVADDKRRKRVRMPVDHLIYSVHYGYLEQGKEYRKRCSDGFQVDELQFLATASGSPTSLVCINPHHMVVEDHRPPLAVYVKNQSSGRKVSARRASKWRWNGGANALGDATRGREFFSVNTADRRFVHTTKYGGGSDMVSKLNMAYNRKRVTSEAEGQGASSGPIVLGKRTVRFSDDVQIVPIPRRRRLPPSSSRPPPKKRQRRSTAQRKPHSARLPPLFQSLELLTVENV